MSDIVEGQLFGLHRRLKAEGEETDSDFLGYILAERNGFKQKIATLETQSAQLRAELADCEAENNYLRADLAETEAELAALRKQEPVVEYMRRRHNPEDTREMWGFDLTDKPLPHGTKLYAAPKPAIPEGYALVPVEPTEAMLKALLKGVRLHSYVRKGMTINEYSYHHEGWNAMLAAQQETTHD